MSVEALSEVLFVIGAVLIGIIPRYHWDPHDWIGGGSLSYRFRQALIFLAIINVVRNSFMKDRRFIQSDDNNNKLNGDNDDDNAFVKFLYFFLLITESFGLGFLMLLTPYFLQCHLASLINIKAGRNLVKWLYLILLLDVSGAIGFTFINKKYYFLKRLGDAVSSIPILQTLSLYQQVISVQDSRVVTIQTVQTVEGYSFFLTLLASIGYFYADNVALAKWSHAVRFASIFMTWTRASFHALLLNLMDEAIQLRQPTRATSTDDRNSTADNEPVEEVDELETLVVHRVR